MLRIYTYATRLLAWLSLVQAFNVNNLNELSTASRSGTVTASGTTSSAATSVTVNGTGASLYGDTTFAAQGLSLVDGNNTFTAIGQDSLGRKDTNAVTVWLPASASFQYDANGNLLSDGRRGFDYDDENQLVRVTVTNAWKTEFQYDGRMRLRVRKEYAWLSGAFTQTNEVRYVYNGMLVIQERNGNNLPVATYTRGLDLSGSRQGAGGIGGLLARTDNGLWNGSGTDGAHMYYSADGNGNVTCLLNSRQIVVGRYVYDPYGNTLSMSGPMAVVNPYRFSSKEYMGNSGLYAYGYRFYEPSLQRWLNKDPIGDEGIQTLMSMSYRNKRFLWLPQEYSVGPNSYSLIDNNPLNDFDSFGEISGRKGPPPQIPTPDDDGNITTTCTKMQNNRKGNICIYRCECPSGYNMGFTHAYTTQSCDLPPPTRTCVPNQPWECPVSLPSVKTLPWWILVPIMLPWPGNPVYGGI